MLPGWNPIRGSAPVAWVDGVLRPGPLPLSRGPGFPEPLFPESPRGVFEIVRVRQGSIEFAHVHVRRLLTSAGEMEIGIDFRETDLVAGMVQVVRAVRERTGDLFLHVAAFPPDSGIRPRLVVTPHPFMGYPIRPMSEGFRLVTAPFRRDERSPLCRHKTFRRPEDRAIGVDGADEVLLLNTAGMIACAYSANIFLIANGVVATPSIEEGAFPGIIREATIREAREIGLEVQERAVRPEEILLTPEVMLTSTMLGLAPVAGIDGNPLPPPTDPPSIPRLRIRVRETAARGALGT
jgi:branched-chain amino acid aminotransferase